MAVLSGGTRNGKPSWKAIGSSTSPKGYGDKNRASTPRRITGVKLKAGVDGTAQAQITAPLPEPFCGRYSTALEYPIRRAVAFD
jgi:hypothetical protein